MRLESVLTSPWRVPRRVLMAEPATPHVEEKEAGLGKSVHGKMLATAWWLESFAFGMHFVLSCLRVVSRTCISNW